MAEMPAAVTLTVDETAALLNLINAKLDLVLVRLAGSQQREIAMALDLSGIEREVAANRDAVNSVITLVERIADELEAAKTDPARVQALADQLRQNTTALGEAVTKNTPAQPLTP